VVEAARCESLGRCYKETALSREEGKEASSEKHSTQSTEDDLKILLRILSIITITSLIHIRDYPLYAWTQVHTIRVHTATSCRDFWQSALQFGRAPFNPHLPSGFKFLRTRWHRLPGAEISGYRPITIRGIFRGVVV